MIPPEIPAIGSEAGPPVRRATWWTLTKNMYAVVAKWFIVPVISAIIGLTVVGRLLDQWEGPDYRIYFVGPTGTAATNGLQDMVDAFDEARATVRSLDGVRVNVYTRDDGGDPAFARSTATELANREDVLLVVGHILSTTTKEALPSYLVAAKPPIPVLLTTETSPNIFPPRPTLDVEFPVYRLSPTDDVQAKDAYEFALGMHAKSFWVVEDTSNAVYASYLADKFIEQAQKYQTGVLLLSTTLSMPSMQTVRQLGVDWVFYAGDWRGALILIHAVKASKLSNIRFILSDSCADEGLLKNGGNDVKGVYVTHPLTVATYKKAHYGVYSQDALRIIDQLLDRANQHFAEYAAKQGGMGYTIRRLLRVHRISDARNVLIETMHTGRDLPFRRSTGERIQFDREGAPVGAHFHVWRIEGGQFTDVH